MEQYLDKVSQAYHGELGSAFAEKTRNRIHWIIKQAEGQNILDIGCSQGLTSLLLGREGKKVLGIDIAESAIDYAKQSLESETSKVKENVSFINGDFLYEDLAEDAYDTIILTEVLEHFITSKNILEKVNGLLKDNGSVVITVPFGINDFPDHKRTLYLTEIYQEISHYFSVNEVKFFGKWIGLVAKKDQEIQTEIPKEVIEEAENTFYDIERNLINSNKQQAQKIESLKEQLESSVDSHAELTNENRSLSKEVEQLVKEVESLNYLRKLVQEKEQQEEKMLTQLNEKKSMIHWLQSNNDRLQGDITSLTVQFSYEKKQFNELEKKNQELLRDKQELSKENDKQQRAFDDKFAQIVEENKNLKEKNDLLRTEIKQTVDDNEQLLENIDTLKMNAEAQEINFEQEASEYKEQLLQLSNEVEEIKTAKEALIDELEKVQLTSRKELQQITEEKEYVIEVANKELNEELHKSLEINQDLIKQLKLKDEELETAKSKVSENEKENVSEWQEKLQNIIHQNNDLTMELQKTEFKYNKEVLIMKEELLTQTELIEELSKDLIKEVRQRELLENKYKSLRNSKLGKVTVKYWSLKSKKRRGEDNYENRAAGKATGTNKR